MYVFAIICTSVLEICFVTRILGPTYSITTRTLGLTYSITFDRIVGFEELGNTDNFTMDVLERRLGKSGNRAVPGQNVYVLL